MFTQMEAISGQLRPYQSGVLIVEVGNGYRFNSQVLNKVWKNHRFWSKRGNSSQGSGRTPIRNYEVYLSTEIQTTTGLCKLNLLILIIARFVAGAMATWFVLWLRSSCPSSRPGRVIVLCYCFSYTPLSSRNSKQRHSNSFYISMQKHWRRIFSLVIVQST